MRTPIARIVVVLIAAAILVPATAARAAKDVFSDEAVEKAIAKATAYLWKTQQKDGSWKTPDNNRMNFIHEHPMGCSALPTYALLESGVKTKDPRMTRALLHLAKTQSVKTYSLGVRAQVWLEAGRQDAKYKDQLNRDVAALVSSTSNGAYSYDCNGDGNSGAMRKDNSASQFAVLGAWAGARANLEIPVQYWHIVMKHWLDDQNNDSGWGYLAGRPPHNKTTPTMTAAGLASLFVCYDNLTATDPDIIRCRPSKLVKKVGGPIADGLNWFDQNFISSFQGELRGLYYYLYGVERVGLASGRKYFGKKDWYRIGATMLLERQNPDGSWEGGWGNAEIGTSFALLFLVRGRNAVLFNKLEYKGDWNNRPRDLACLTRWISGNFESKVNWQIINTSVPVSEWHDAPILYIAGSKKPAFTDEELTAMEIFVQQGGTIFSVSECRGTAFTRGMNAAYAKMFPNYKIAPCKPDHGLYDAHYRLRGTPRFSTVSNGVRPLAIHTSSDLSLSWQTHKYKTKKYDFQAATNVAMYVTDKGAGLRRRGTTLWPEETLGRIPKKLSLARIKYVGNYDPEPLAYERFSRLMVKEEKTRVRVIEPMAATELATSGAKLAVLTGTGKFTLPETEIKALRDFVNGGGTLFLEAAGGEDTKSTKGFVASAQVVLAGAFKDSKLVRLPPNADLYKLPGMEIDAIRWRRQTQVTMLNHKIPQLQALVFGTRAGVIFSRHDITAGLLGTPVAGIYGYHPGGVNDPGSAYELMRNIITYANKDAKDED